MNKRRKEKIYRKNLSIIIFVVFIIFFIVCNTSFVFCSILNVPADYVTIQDAITAAGEEDTIQVAPGVYNENLIWNSKSIHLIGSGADTTIIDVLGSGRCLTMTSVPAFATITGFTFRGGNVSNYGGGLYLDHSHPTLSNNIIIENITTASRSLGGGIYINYSNPVLINNIIKKNRCSDEGRGAGIFLNYSLATLRNNIITENFTYKGRGGGVYLQFSSPEITDNIITFNTASNSLGLGGGLFLIAFSNPKISRNTIESNLADSKGGGMWIDNNSKPIISNNIISKNSARWGGGGIGMELSAPTITNNTFSSNTNIATNGGAFYINASTPKIQNNTIIGNSTASAGAGLYIVNSIAELTNNIIVKNYGRYYGAGVYLDNASSILINNTISENSLLLGNAGAGVYNYGTGVPNITNCIIWGNKGASDLSGTTATFSDVGTGEASGNGNISINPMFIDTSNNDYHLQSGSPCENTGTLNNAPEYDFDGEPRLASSGGDGIPDIGADEILNNKSPKASGGNDINILTSEQPLTIILGLASDEDGDALIYRWTENGIVLLDWTDTGENGEANLNLIQLSALSAGVHNLTLEVSDGKLTASDTMILTVANTPPVSAPAGGGTFEIFTNINLSGTVSDYDGDILSYRWYDSNTEYRSGSIKTNSGGAPVEVPVFTIEGGLPLGIYEIFLEVSDGVNPAVKNKITIVTLDTTAPTLTPESNIMILWPPNDKMVDILISANVQDNSGSSILDVIVNCADPDLDENDILVVDINQTTGLIKLQLRAKRTGYSNERIYNIAITATDASLNSSSAAVSIVSPHDQRKK
ncbi:MAG: right-handed parallel beta-helix repeat-containing protein [Candidatus Firestonebacteria bacterium]|nr:right-handed parallel beta-helix repeat-containing protein [Candidatus Firestonebacteria bacterium]